MADDEKTTEQLCKGIAKTAVHRKMVVSSTDTGTYDFSNASIKPDTSAGAPTIEQLETLYWKNPLIHKAINLRANRLIGDGFELQPAEGPDVNPVLAEQAMKECTKLLKRINYITFLRQAAINAYVAGNEWTELIHNAVGNMVSAVHGDFRTIDFKRSFITNKILLDDNGEPVGYWQYIENLMELYQSLAVLFGSVETLKNLEAAKDRLQDSQTYVIRDTQGNEIAAMAKKPNYMFLKKEEVAHLSFNNLNDNLYGVSLILPAYDAATHLDQVMFAMAEAINEMGYPKPVVYVGDEKHAPNQTLNDQAESAITNPVRKEGFVLPYYMKMEYLQPSGSGSGNINDYPQWFVTAVAIGLRVPRELLTGEGEANRATSMQASTDFDKDIEADRRMLEEYLYTIFSRYLETHGFKNSAGGRCTYVPQIQWPKLVTEDEKVRNDMILQKWSAGLMTFNEARIELDLPEVEDPERAESYQDEIQRAGLNAPFQPPSVVPPIPPEEPIEAQHRLDSSEDLNPALNDKFHTQDIDYKGIARDEVGKRIVTVSEPKARQIRDTLVNALPAHNTNLAKIEKTITKIGDYAPHEAKRIIRTELSTLVSTAREDDARRRGLTHKQWLAVMDGKTSGLSKALHGQVRPIDADFETDYQEENENGKPVGETKHWKGAKPPEHPNSRCKVVYFGTDPSELVKAQRFTHDELEKISESVGDLAPEPSITKTLSERTKVPQERLDSHLYDVLLMGFGTGAIATLLSGKTLSDKDYKKLADSVRGNPAKSKELLESVRKTVKDKARLKEILKAMQIGGSS